MPNREQKRELRWQRQKYAIDKALELATNPTTMLIGGFVATNVLQNTRMGNVQVDQEVTTLDRPWWSIVFPFLPASGQTTTVTPGGVRQVNFLTEDQANVLRGGLVIAAAAKSGVLQDMSALLSGALKLVAP